MKRLRRRFRQDEGQTSVLIIGLSMVTLLFALTMLAISVVNLEARKLLAAADDASSAAATVFTAEANSSGATLVLSEASAEESVTNHLRDTGAHTRFENLSVDGVIVASGGDTVTVQLRATARPPVVSWFMPDGVTVQAESAARTSLER